MKYDIAVCDAVILSAANDWNPYIGSVGILDDRIACVTKEKIQKSSAEIWIDGRNRVLMPGLVNAHCHGDMTLARGMGDDLTLGEQNEKFADTNWFYSLITDEDRYASRRLTYYEALRSGTTFILENMYWGLGEKSALAMASTGIRGALAEDIRIDFSKPDEFLSEEKILQIRTACEKAGIIPVIGSISEEDFDRNRLRNIKEIVDRHRLIETFHLAETDWRLQMVREKFGCGSVELLAKEGILNHRIIGSHVIQLNDKEIELLAETGTNVANTPLCEMKIADGIAPIPQMVKAGVNVCLGTDGAMWNNSNDIFREMKGMALLHTANSGIRSLGTKDILNMATINGAKAFGMEEEFGTIEEGKSADFILVHTDRLSMQPLRLGKGENITSAMVYCATGSDVSDVFVRGKWILQNGVFTDNSIDETIQIVCEASDRIARKIYFS